MEIPLPEGWEVRSVTPSSLDRVFPTEHHMWCVETATYREQRARQGVMGAKVPKTHVAAVLVLANPALLPIITCSEPLFLPTMSETSCGMLCSGHDIIWVWDSTGGILLKIY